MNRVIKKALNISSASERSIFIEGSWSNKRIYASAEELIAQACQLYTAPKEDAFSIYRLVRNR